MGFLEMVRFEWKTRLSQPSVLVFHGVFFLILIYGLMSGARARETRMAAIGKHQEEVSKALTAWKGRIVALEELGRESGVPAWAGSPMDAVFPTAMPPGPMADFSIGQSDLLPFMGEVSLWNPDIRLFSKYEFEDPVALSVGTFDLSKAIVLVLPLLLIALCFDCLSSERDGRRLGLVLAQGTNIPRFYWMRFSIRAIPVLALILAVAVLGLCVHGKQVSLSQRLPHFAVWMLGALLYAAFWLGTIARLSASRKSGEFNLLSLLLFWIGLTLIVPGTIATVAEALYPPPSRVAYLAETREVENETELAHSSLANQYLMDHPDLMAEGDSAIPDYVRTAYLVTTRVDEATRPILQEFESAAQKRDAVIAALRYFSPAMIAVSFFNEVAGTSANHHRDYMHRVRHMKADFAKLVAPHVIAGKRFPSSSFESLPEFEYEDAARVGMPAKSRLPLLYLAAVSILLFVDAHRRFATISGPQP